VLKCSNIVGLLVSLSCNNIQTSTTIRSDVLVFGCEKLILASATNNKVQAGEMTCNGDQVLSSGYETRTSERNWVQSIPEYVEQAQL